MEASEFIATLGINTHVGSNPYNDPAEIERSAAYLGFKSIRQSSPINATSLDEAALLGKSGLSIDLIINGGGPVSLAGAMQNVYALAPYLSAVEGVNEAAIYPITYKGITGINAAVALQKDLYAAVRSDAALDKAAVYSFTIGGADPSAYPSIGNISAYTDYASVHAYPPDGLRPIFVIHAAIAGGRTDAPGKPVVLTETGYYTLTDGVGWGGVPASMQANYLLDETLDEAAAGVPRTYLYDLIDDGADSSGKNQEDHFGLFNNDGSPKPAATAFHNLTTILNAADATTGPASAAQPAFTFSASGLPYNYTGNTLELDGRDGSHMIAIWNEEQLWNTTTLKTVPPTDYPVTVTLGATYHTVNIYDPTVKSTAIETLHDVSRVSLTLRDHPYIIQVEPNPIAGASTTPASSVVSAGTGDDVLALMMSEDAYKGNAQFVVSVDGRQIGGTQTATALHDQGDTQEFDIRGTFAAGLHKATITFLSDAYGGNAATDRNLYVDSAKIDGQPIGGAVLDELKQGAQSFNFSEPKVSEAGNTVALGTGPHSLAIQVSEQAYLGNASFTVSVDGKQITGVQTASVSHTSGAVQLFDVLGNFAVGTHQASVAFLNDNYGGSATMDRNLYVQGATIDGSPVPNSALNELKGGAQFFDFTVKS